MPIPLPSKGLTGLLISSSMVVAATMAPESGQAPDAFAKEAAPLIKKYCADCHGAKEPVASFNVLAFKTGADVLKARERWAKASQHLTNGHMPPEGMPQPTKAERDKMVRLIDTTLTGDCKLPDPGRVTLRRLNRAEYNNTIRDLTGLDLKPADDFPSDDVGYGFDNIGDVLSISPLLMEKYLKAAERVSKAVIEVPGPKVKKVEVSSFGKTEGSSIDGEGALVLFSQSAPTADVRFPDSGPYKVRVRAFGDQAGDEPAKMALLLDGQAVQTFEVKAVRTSPVIYEVPIDVQRGVHKIAVSFLNDYYKPAPRGAQIQDRNLIVEWMEVVGPLNGAFTPSEAHRRIITEQPTATNRREVAQRILGAFAGKAYRRPITPEETERLMKLFDFADKNKEPFERGIQLGVQGILSSPSFIFRAEADPAATTGAARPLDDYEVATRLSYFLWSSMPDETLSALAAKGQLKDPKVRKAQVERMLKDPKARALGDNFAGQWLQLRKLHDFAPDPKQFPGFTDSLRNAMLKETTLYFNAVVSEDRSVLEFIDSDYTYLNGPLAQHYGIGGVSGEAFQKVKLSNANRGGLITHASILALTSNPTRTSPVKRGKFILDQLLGTPLPPPPPGVGNLEETKDVIDAQSLRKRLEQHRKDPQCASCHSKLDPLGFGLENFDPVGVWRLKDGKFEIDSKGELPDGKTFSGPSELKALLMSRKSDFVRCLAEKMLTYAIGRGTESIDKCAVDEIVKEASAGGYKFSTLITSVVESDPFLKQKVASK